MDDQFAVEETVCLRPQPQLHRCRTKARESADRSGCQERHLQADRGRARPATRATGPTPTTAPGVWNTGVVGDTELTLGEILPVQIKVNGVLTRQKGAARRVTDPPAEGGLGLGRVHHLDILNAAERAAVRRHISRVYFVAVAVEPVQAITEGYTPSNE